MEVEEAGVGWDAYVVPRRVDLHRRDIQECRKAGILLGASLDAPGLFNHGQAWPVPCLAHSFNGTCYCLGVRDAFRSHDAYAKRYPEEIATTRRGNMSTDQHSILA